MPFIYFETYAASICGNDTTTSSQSSGLGSQSRKGDELVGDDLDANDLTDGAEILCGHTEQPGHGVEDVSENELQGQRVGIEDLQVLAPPAEKAVDEADKGDDAQQGGRDHAGDLQAEPGAVGKGVQGVGGLVLVIVGDHDAA